MEDKFGKLGLVTASIIKKSDDSNVMELFVMSCRAMGFGLEDLMLRMIAEDCVTGKKKLIGRFVPSDRNSPAAAFFKNNRFEPISDTEWLLPSLEIMPSPPNWFIFSKRS